MGVARVPRAADSVSISLAGLQAGMAAAWWLLLWLGINAVWRQSSFWTAENLWASTFHGAGAIHRGFSVSTLSGLALYLLVYSVLGGIFAAIVRSNVARLRLLLIGIVWAVGWYYLLFHVIWQAVSPLVTLLHAAQPTLLGHVIYGAALAQFPRFLPAISAPPSAEPVPVPAVAESGPEFSSGTEG